MRCVLRLAVLVLLALPARGFADEVPTAEALAQKMLDGPGLYTVSGGLKPVSEGFWQAQFPAAQNSSPEVDEVRTLLAGLPLGPDLEAGVHVFATAFHGKRTAHAFIAHKPSLRALIARRADVFAPLGITVSTPPQEVMERIDRAPSSARWRAYGLVFGYPEYAVEFFVAAGEKQDATKKFVERDFINLPTFESVRGLFTYAVPKGHAERYEDVVLKAATIAILDQYRPWRQAYLGDGNAGAVALLRDWVARSVRVAPLPALVACPRNVIPTCPLPTCEPRRFFHRLRSR